MIHVIKLAVIAYKRKHLQLPLKKSMLIAAANIESR